MQIRSYWEDDDIDVPARAAGLSPEGDVAEVARRCGKHRNWASYRIADGDLEARTFGGRKYVTGASLDKVWNSEGPGTARHELERLKQCDPDAAQELHRRMYPEQWQGDGLVPQATPAGRVDDSDFDSDYLRTFGRRK